MKNIDFSLRTYVEIKYDDITDEMIEKSMNTSRDSLRTMTKREIIKGKRMFVKYAIIKFKGNPIEFRSVVSNDRKSRSNMKTRMLEVDWRVSVS